MFEISTAPVRAVIVTHFVIGVPELVMKVFWPVDDPLAASHRRAWRVVRVAPASVPASASVRPNAPSTRPRSVGRGILLLLLGAE